MAERRLPPLGRSNRRARMIDRILLTIIIATMAVAAVLVITMLVTGQKL